MGFVGQSVRRIEDGPLLRGAGTFIGDLKRPHSLHMKVVRSEIAHGTVRAIDVAAARASRGVAAVWVGADVADIPPIGFRQVRVPGLFPYRQPILAQERVRYVGEPLAVVFADDPYRAEDAACLVAADIEPLTPLVCATGPPGAFGAGQTTEPAVIEKGYGDVAAALANAPHNLSLTLSVGRHTGVPLETRGGLAEVEQATGILRVFGAAKIPHINRDMIADMLGLARDQIHLHETHVGGGFGVRGELYPEDVLIALAALRLGRPVKWIEDRNEHLIATNHSRDQVHHVHVGFDDDGVILALDDTFFVDQGAYVRTHAATIPDLSAAMLPGPYRVPAYRARGHIRLTNKTPCGTYRAPGRFEATFVRERVIDAVAAQLHLDTVAVRRKNLIGKREMPFRRGLEALGTQVIYDSGDYAKLLDTLLDHVGWDTLSGELAARRSAGESVGAGFGHFVEKSGLGPFDDVRLTLCDTGKAELVTGVASVGQGVETILAQVVADELEIDVGDVTVVHGQTDQIARGMGAFAARTTVMTTAATVLAAQKLRAALFGSAAPLLQSTADKLRLEQGAVHVAGAAGPSIDLGAALRAASPQTGRLSAEATFNSTHMTYPYGVHFAIARVDPDTCAVTIERFVVAYDVGRAINPMLIEGQIVGGVAQGLGGALLEEFRYDADGQPLCASLADYLMPTAAEVPKVEVLITEDAPSPLNPLGVKGAGEAGANGVGAAVAGAVDAALNAPLLVRHLPLSPSRLHAAMAALAQDKRVLKPYNPAL